MRAIEVLESHKGDFHMVFKDAEFEHMIYGAYIQFVSLPLGDCSYQYVSDIQISIFVKRWHPKTNIFTWL